MEWPTSIAFFRSSFHYLGEIVGVGVHVIALPRLAGAAMTSTIMSDTAVALARQEEHLVFKSVAVQRIRMVKNDGLSFPPIFKVEFCAVFGGDSAHGFLFIGFVSIAARVLLELVGQPSVHRELPDGFGFTLLDEQRTPPRRLNSV